MKKRIILLLMAAALLLTCFGCKSASTEETAANDEVVQGEENTTVQTDLPQKVEQTDSPSGSGGSTTQNTPTTPNSNNNGGGNTPADASETPPSGSSTTPTEDNKNEPGGATEAVEANLKLMSYNIRYTDDPNGHSIDERAPRVKQIIAKHDPDVVAMMEVTVPWAQHLNADYAGRYGVVIHYRSETNPEGLAILYKKSTLTMVKEGFFWLSETPDQESLSYDTDLPRICTWMQLKHKATGKIFMYYNLHLGGSEKSNIGSYQQVAAEMAKYSKYPCFAGGDLNMTPGASYNYFFLTMDEARTSISNSDYLKSTYATGYPRVTLPVPDGDPIDYIFHQEEKAQAVSYEVDQSTIDGRWPSDHFPIICTYKI